MTVAIERLTKARISQMMSEDIGTGLSAEGLKVFDSFLLRTTTLWAGFTQDKLVCVWGLIPPTLLSDQAYLWLYTTEAISGHEFLFVRHSQLAVAKMLKEHPIIIGHAAVGNTRGIRWLRWLGAKFGEPEGQLIPFVIRGKNG